MSRLNVAAFAAVALTLLPAWVHPEDAASSVLVETAPAVTLSLAESIPTFGTVDADPDYVQTLSLPHGGLVDRVWVSTGQRVDAGDRLLSIVAAPDGRMQFLQAKNALDYAEQELSRQRRLLAQKLASNADVEQARVARDDASATVESLKARGLDAPGQILDAPVSGIITRLDVAQGDRVPADATALLIAAADHLIARLGVEPENVGRIAPGAQVSLSPVFGSSGPVTARIREVHGMIDAATNLVEVLVDLPVDAFPAKVLGMRIVGNIMLAAHDAIAVPRSAVLADAGGSFVFVARNGVAERVNVTTGMESGDMIEISGPVAPPDRVVTLGNYELGDGMAVRESH